jgi:hypothetical protein
MAEDTATVAARSTTITRMVEERIGNTSKEYTRNSVENYFNLPIYRDPVLL